MGTGSMLANRFLGKRFGKPAGWLGGAAAMQAYKMANGQDFDLSDFALDLGGQALGDYAFTKLGGKFAKSGAKNLAKAEQIAASQAATKAAAGAAASGGGPGMISKLAAKFKGKGKVGAALAGLGALGFGLGSSSASEPETSGMTGQAQTYPQQGTGSILGGLGASLGATALVGKLGGGVGKMGAAGAAAYDIANGDFSSIPSDMYHGMVDSKALSMAGKGMSS